MRARGSPPRLHRGSHQRGRRLGADQDERRRADAVEGARPVNPSMLGSSLSKRRRCGAQILGPLRRGAPGLDICLAHFEDVEQHGADGCFCIARRERLLVGFEPPGG